MDDKEELIKSIKYNFIGSLKTFGVEIIDIEDDLEDISKFTVTIKVKYPIENIKHDIHI